MDLSIRTARPNNFELFSPHIIVCKKTKYHAVKPVLEYTASIIALIAIFPIMLCVAVAIKATSNGPIFYTQYRSGYKGRIFKLYKFRTMYHHLCDDGQAQATENDVRITKIGRFLRRSSIDELPQLLNVLQGNMNLIGPRPHSVPMDHEYAPYITNYWQRYDLKPGLTGWAQINDLRGETQTIDHMHNRVSHDIAYQDKQSFYFDMHIVIKTIFLLLRPQ